ncbi:hypothetical protein ABW20_dc0106578 [Dactylellina cionopaga]|nr:hypothetical protein ABW20_dc0106578 [Dactylellina cionopaga]
MLASSRTSLLLSSLAGNANGGPYPTASSLPLQPLPNLARPVILPSSVVPRLRRIVIRTLLIHTIRILSILNNILIHNNDGCHPHLKFLMVDLLLCRLVQSPIRLLDSHLSPLAGVQILNTPDHISHLQKCWEILKRDDREEMISFGMPERVGEIRLEIYRMWLMVRLAWRIVQALKNAKGGTRIAECGEWVMHVIETNKSVSPEKFDPIPMQTLACALTYPHPSMSLNSKIKDTVTPLQRLERDNMAIEYFEMGFPQNDAAALFLPSSVYAKAHQTGHVMMSKARFTDLVCSEGEAPCDNLVLKNVEGFFERKSENGSSTGAEEADSNSGRDSGIDVGPVGPVVEEKPGAPPQNRRESGLRDQSPPMNKRMSNGPDQHQPTNRREPAFRDQQQHPMMSRGPPAPRIQEKSSTSALPPLKPYSSQLPSASTSATALPIPPPKQQFQQQSSPQPSPQQLSPQYQSPPHTTRYMAPHPDMMKPYPQMPYDYTGSSDSLSSDQGNGKSKIRASIGAKFGFRRKS